METNEYRLKISGICNIPQPLRNGFTYDLEILNAEVREIKRVPTDDGQEDEIAKLVVSELSEVVLKSNGKPMTATKKGSQSKLMRYLIQQIAEKKGLDPDKYYQERMAESIDKLKLELEV
jgi:hypothetical protein